MAVTKADEACIKIIQKQLTERRTFGWDYANALALILLFNPNNVVRRPQLKAKVDRVDRSNANGGGGGRIFQGCLRH